MNIISDFIDYYDEYDSQGLCNYSYERIRKPLRRNLELKKLKNMGIKTIEVKAVNDMMPSIEKVVVYTDPYMHSGHGKQVMTMAEARMTYPTALASKYYTENLLRTYKVLYIGDTRYVITIDNKERLITGEIIDIKKEVCGLCSICENPIFSIDYIKTDDGMLAVDFNDVENLSRLSLENFVPAEEVVWNIVKAIRVRTGGMYK